MSLSKLISPPNKTYLEYQKEGIVFALARKSTLIADEMGLGKTVQAIGVINNLETDSISKVLIVCPASLVTNWWNEIDNWIVNPLKFSINICSYEQVTKYSTFDIDLLIIDEAHYCKTADAIRTKNVKAVAKKAKRLILLTGTPIENKPVELWTLLQMLDPDTWDKTGRLRGKLVATGEGAGFWKYVSRYCNAHQERRGNRLFWSFDGNSNLDELNQKLRSTIMIRRMKKDVLKELPSKRHQVVVLPKGNSFYDLSDLNEDNFENVISGLTNNKVAFEEFSKKWHEQGLEKIDYVVEHVKQCLNETGKIILFARHKDVIDKLIEKLNYAGMVTVTSDMSTSDRQMAVDVFQDDPNCRIILGSIDCMGVGFTLTASSLVIFAEISPVPGKMAQAADRAHRITQKESVLVNYLAQDGSIDARMLKILIKKQRVLSAALDVVRMATDDDDDDEVIAVKPCSHLSVVVKGSRYRCADCNAIMR